MARERNTCSNYLSSWGLRLRLKYDCQAGKTSHVANPYRVYQISRPPFGGLQLRPSAAIPLTPSRLSHSHQRPACLSRWALPRAWQPCNHQFIVGSLGKMPFAYAFKGCEESSYIPCLKRCSPAILLSRLRFTFQTFYLTSWLAPYFSSIQKCTSCRSYSHSSCRSPRRTLAPSSPRSQRVRCVACFNPILSIVHKAVWLTGQAPCLQSVIQNGCGSPTDWACGCSLTSITETANVDNLCGAAVYACTASELSRKFIWTFLLNDLPQSSLFFAYSFQVGASLVAQICTIEGQKSSTTASTTRSSAQSMADYICGASLLTSVLKIAWLTVVVVFMLPF